jgi:hypothetical protein
LPSSCSSTRPDQAAAGGADGHDEYGGWFRDAGFDQIEVIPLEGLGANCVVVGHKP